MLSPQMSPIRGPDEPREPTTPGLGGAITWPSPLRDVARAIAQDIDNSDAAQEFEAQIEEETQVHRGVALTATPTREAAAVRIQAAQRGKMGRRKMSMRRNAPGTDISHGHSICLRVSVFSSNNVFQKLQQLSGVNPNWTMAQLKCLIQPRTLVN